MFPYKAVHVWVRKYMTHPGLNVSKTHRPSLQGKDLRYRNVVIPSGDWSGSSLITSVFKHYVLHRNKKKKKNCSCEKVVHLALSWLGGFEIWPTPEGFHSNSQSNDQGWTNRSCIVQ